MRVAGITDREDIAVQIGAICEREVVTIDKEESVRSAARIMRSEHVGDVIVVDAADGGRKPIGVVTDRDLVVEVLAKDIDLDSVAIGDLCDARIVTARFDAGLFETLRLMSVKGVRRIPVLDADGALYGILSLDDILAVLTKHLELLRDLGARRAQRERSLRD